MIAAIRAGQAYVEMALRKEPLERGLRALQTRLSGLSSSLRGVGSSLAQAGISIGLPLGLAASTFAEFEQSMARVKAVTEDITENEFKSLYNEAKRLGLVTVFSAKQAADAMVVFSLAGLRANETLKATGPALDLAAAGQIEIAQAADIALTIMKQFGYEADHLPVLLDVLGKAMSTANTDILLLGEGFKKVGLAANTAGQDFHEVTAALQILSDAGSKGEEGGTALRGIYASLTSQSPEAVAELQKLGVSIADAKRNVKPLSQILTELSAAYAKLRAQSGGGGFDVMASLGKIFTVRTAGPMSALIDKVEHLNTLTGKLRNSTGTLAYQSETQLATLKGAWLLLTSSVEGLGISIGETIAPMLKSMGQTISTVTNVIAQWSEKNPELFRTITQVGFGVLVAAGAFTALGLTAGVLAFAVGGLASMFGLAKGALAIFLNPAFVALRWAISFGYALAQTTEVGRRAWASMQAGAGAAFNYLRRGFEIVRGDVTLAWGGISAALSTGDLGEAAGIAWDLVRLEFARALDWIQTIGETLWDGFIDAHYRMGQAIMDEAMSWWASLSSLWVETTEYLFEDWDGFAQSVMDTWEVATDFVHGALQGLQQAFTDVFTWVTKPFALAADFIRENFGGAIAWVSDQWQAFTGLFGGRTDEVTGPGQGSGGESSRERRLREIEEYRQSFGTVRDAAKEERDAATEAARTRRQSGIEDLQKSIKERAGWAQFVRDIDALNAEMDKEYERNLPRPSLTKTLPSIDTTGAASAGKADVQGTFVARALQGLGASKSLNERLVNVGQQQLTELKGLRQEVKAQRRLEFE